MIYTKFTEQKVQINVHSFHRKASLNLENLTSIREAFSMIQFVYSCTSRVAFSLPVAQEVNKTIKGEK